MTKKIVKRTDANNEILYFYTHSDAVDVGEGNATTSLTNALNNKASTSDVQTLSNDTLRKSPQSLSSQEKTQALTNLGLNGVDDEPIPNSDNLVKSGGVKNELALGAVYDVSAKNPTAGLNNDGKFESLSALLSDANLNTLIPTAVRKGGMSIKFVQSSDNKYMQYRLMTTSFSTNEADWQGVDDEPTAGSENLVKSDGVFNFISFVKNAIRLINNYLSLGYIYAGIANPSTAPVNGRVIYFTSTAGTYTNMGSIVVGKGISIIKYNGDMWSVETLIPIDDVPLQESSGLVKSGGVWNGQKELHTEISNISVVDSFIVPISSSRGFYTEDLSGNTTGTFRKKLYELDASTKARYAGITIKAAPRSAAYCSVTDISDNILWQSNNVNDFPKTLLFSDYPNIAKVYVSSEYSVLANPLCSYAYSLRNEIDNYCDKLTLNWLPYNAINSDGEVYATTGHDCVVYDLTNIVRVDVTADCLTNTYIFIDDSHGNHLISITGRALENAVLLMSDYPDAKTLKVTSVRSATHAVVVYKMKSVKPVFVNNVSFKRGSFDSSHVIRMPYINSGGTDVSRFSNYPLPLKISYYEGVVGCNLSARDYCKNGTATQTVFVSPSGNDANNGLYPDHPLVTLEAALNVSGVSTIVLLPGIYCAGVNFTAGLEITNEVNIIGSGNVIVENYGNPIVIKASIYIENVVFKYGNSCLKTDLTTELCAFYKCKFLESDAENGLSALGGAYILEECEASNNFRDGFNYHRSSIGNIYYPKVLEINCEGYYNGARDTNNINNGSTGHEAAVLIRLLCSYGYSRGCAVADVANCWSLNIGVTAFSTIEHGDDNTVKSNFGLQHTGSAGAGTRMWLIGCKSFGSMYDVYAVADSYMFRTSAFPKEYGTGTYSLYQVEYESN